jgi:hypothetical protein
MDIYDEILQRASECASEAAWRDAFKWLANEFVKVNEDAKDFEDRAKEQLTEKQFGQILYGSEKAYEQAKEREERLAKAVTKQEKNRILVEMVLAAEEEEKDYPLLFDEAEEIEEGKDLELDGPELDGPEL